MAQVDKTVLVEYGCREMFSLVRDVERYPSFLPWCAGSSVHAAEGDVVRASLDIDYHGVRTSFSTENLYREPSSIEMRLLQGPFKQLHGTWQFTALGESACKIQLRLKYEFANRILEKLVGPVFSFIANSLVDAFVRRAQQIHGPR